MNRLASVILATVLVIGGGAIALGATGGSSPGGNAAVVQYEPTPPVTPPTVTPPPPETSNKKLKTKKQKEGGVKDIKCAAGSSNPNCDEGGVNNAGDQGGNGNGKGKGPGTRFASTPLETASTGPSGGEGGLPFTGFDILALAGFGLLLVLIGLTQRRLSARGTAKR